MNLIYIIILCFFSFQSYANFSEKSNFPSSEDIISHSDHHAEVSLSSALLVIGDSSTYDYGLLLTGFVATKELEVTNIGGETATLISPLSIPAPYSYVGGEYPGTNGDCENVFGVGETCIIEIEYAPFATATDFSDVTLFYNNSVGTVSASIELKGRGYLPLQSLILSSPVTSLSLIHI